MPVVAGLSLCSTVPSARAVAKRSRVWEGTGLGWTSRPCWRWDLGGLAVLTIYRAGAWTGLSGLEQ
jgi:hypothetical protein